MSAKTLADDTRTLAGRLATVVSGGSRASEARYPPIAEHGLTGDLYSVALVRTHRTVDWHCCQGFDTPSVYAAIPDADQRACSAHQARCDAWSSKQHHLPDTNLLIGRLLMPDGVREVHARAFESVLFQRDDLPAVSAVECVEAAFLAGLAVCSAWIASQTSRPEVLRPERGSSSALHCAGGEVKSD
jgi:hypothetical protein